MTDPGKRPPRWENRRLVDKTAPWTTGRWSGHNDPVTGPLPACRSGSPKRRPAVISALPAATSPAAAEVLEEIRVSVGVALMWPLVAVFGFPGLPGVVVARGGTATARYEFGRKGARDPQGGRSPAGAGSAPPAGSRRVEAEAQPKSQAV